MMDTDIRDMLEDIGRVTVPRLDPAVTVEGDTALSRRANILRAIRGTVLPRRLEFLAANGDCLAIEVNNSRVTDVARVRSGAVPDFETEPRAALAEKLATLLTDIATAPTPVLVSSMKPDVVMEADDVGITLSEIEAACADVEPTAEPIVSVVPDVIEQTGDAAPAAKADALAEVFFEGAEKIATACVLANTPAGTKLRASGRPDVQPDAGLLAGLAADLAGWDADTAPVLNGPQLIVMRPSGGKGTGVAVLKDDEQIAIATHDARKLGAIVSLWRKSLEALS